MARLPRISTRSGRRRARRGEKGMGLIELVIAMTVLTVGMMGSMIMILIGMESNSRNKVDNGSTILDQEILEVFATLKNYPKAGYVTIYDCAATSSNAHEAALGGGTGTFPAGYNYGAVLYTTSTVPAGSNVGDVDWTQATPTLATSTTQGYAMMYQTCGGDIYEVRWNIQDANATVPAGTASRLNLLTVSARQTEIAHSANGMLFQQPTTLRTLIESSEF